MKYVTLIRHADSDWDSSAVNDHSRTLNTRGLRDAPVMGERLRSSDLNIEAILTSSAVRARTTADLIARALDISDSQITESKQLYNAEAPELLRAIQKTPNELTHIALVAHNPGISYLCESLGDSQVGSFPPCTIATLSFELDDWSAIHELAGQIIRFDYPGKE